MAGFASFLAVHPIIDQSSFARLSAPALQRRCLFSAFPSQYRGFPVRHKHDLPLAGEYSSLLWRKHQLGFAAEEEMETFFETRQKRARELSDAASHLIGPRFDLIGGLERFRGEESFVILDDPDGTISKDTMNVSCEELIKAGKCVEEVFDQSIYTLGRNVRQCLGEGQAKLVDRIPHFVEDMKNGKAGKGRLLIPKHSKVALDSSLIMYLLQPMSGRLGEAPPQKETLLNWARKLSAWFLPPNDQDFAQRKETLLQIFGQPFFFVVSPDPSFSLEIPSAMLERQHPPPTSEERKKLQAAFNALFKFCEQDVIAVYGERGTKSMFNLLELLRCNCNLPFCSVYRGQVLLNCMGPEVHLMLVGNHDYHGKICRGIRGDNAHHLDVVSICARHSLLLQGWCN